MSAAFAVAVYCLRTASLRLRALYATDKRMTPAESRALREADASRASRTDSVPKLDAAATPGKFDRFVYDEAGIFGPSIRDRLQDLAYRFAAAANVPPGPRVAM